MEREDSRAHHFRTLVYADCEPRNHLTPSLPPFFIFSGCIVYFFSVHFFRRTTVSRKLGLQTVLFGTTVPPVSSECMLMCIDSRCLWRTADLETTTPPSHSLDCIEKGYPTYTLIKPREPNRFPGGDTEAPPAFSVGRTYRSINLNLHKIRVFIEFHGPTEYHALPTGPWVF